MLMRDYNYLTLPSLGTVLGSRGYIGTYMHSGDTRFDNKRRWLLQWFDEFHDMTNTFADAPQVSSWGVADPVMFDFALEWADGWAERERPFFMVLFTVINHHPFRVPPDFDSPYPHDSDNTYHRFINTMTYQDRATGDFIRQASSRPWYDNTYFLVLSDTGQVMGERDVTNDLGRLPPYEASMWIPLLLMGPGLDAPQLNGDIRRQVASQIDVPPTVLDLLGIVTPNPFAGRTLLVPVPYEESLALMSNPYGDVWVALRQGDFKTIHGRSSGTTQRFNLRTDPWERVDLVETGGYDPSADVRLLDAWVDVQEYLVFRNLFWDPRFSVAE
jgi:phosphoglycerol transferase MdoB-like AlkP superfamily enzyme